MSVFGNALKSHVFTCHTDTFLFFLFSSFSKNKEKYFLLKPMHYLLLFFCYIYTLWNDSWNLTISNKLIKDEYNLTKKFEWYYQKNVITFRWIEGYICKLIWINWFIASICISIISYIIMRNMIKIWIIVISIELHRPHEIKAKLSLIAHWFFELPNIKIMKSL